MRTTATRTMETSGLSTRECVAAWAVAFTLVMGMLASSVVALLFEGWV